MELFVGLDVPSDVNRELVHIQNRLRHFDSSGKYEVVENYHLTLRYIGEMLRMETVAAHLEQIRFPRFVLQLHELGMFENPERNVVWVNVKEENDNLQALHRLIDRTLARAGVQMEQFSFVPHISLAFECDASISKYFSSCTVTPLTFEVANFYLYVVDHTPEGPRFRKIRNFNLTP